MMQIHDALRTAIGAAYVLTDADTARWCRDWTGKYTSTPLAVLRPADTAQVAAIMRIAHDTATPVVPVGGNTGLTGATQNTGALMLSLDRLNQITDIDAAGGTATVGAGVILSHLHDAAEAVEMIFPLTFGARGSATIGGVLATNAGGSNVLRYGNTRDLVLGIEAVRADGQIIDLMGKLHKDNSGLNLKHLLIGSEGTLAVITRAIVKLHPRPTRYATAMVALRDLDTALTLLNTLQAETGRAVEAFEYMPRSYIDGHLAIVAGAQAPFAQSYDTNILVELGATSSTVNDTRLHDQLTDILAMLHDRGDVLDAVIAQNEAQRRTMWARREAAAEIAFHRKPFVDTDVAVGLSDVGTFLHQAAERLASLDPAATDLVVAHLGDGNIHYTAYPSRDDPKLSDAIREMVEDIVTDLRGSFSAEHGVGLSKLQSMRRRKDPVALDTMRAIKHALDAQNILNPGKVFPAS